MTATAMNDSAPASRRDYNVGIFLVLLATLGWSLAGVFVRILPPLDGWQINTWRGYSMSVFLLLYIAAVYPRQPSRAFSDAPLTGLIACAAFFAIGSTLYVTSLTLTSTANVSCIVSTSPLFAAVLGRFLIGERTSAASWAAAMLALGGVAIIVNNDLEAGHWLGSLTSVLVAASFAGQTVMLRRFRAFDMVPAICIGGFAVFLFAGFFGDGFAVPPVAVLLLCLMGPLQLGIPLILYARSARHVPAVTLSLVALLDAILSPAWSWLGAGEIPSASAMIGGAIIIGAVLLSIAAGRRSVRPDRRPETGTSGPS
jgi:drug/metabolite transporter (DMT)-like permease